MTLSPAAASIIGAALAAIASIIVSVINARFQQARFLNELDKQNSLMSYRLQKLEEKVDKHNNFDIRLVSMEEQIKTLFNYYKKDE